MSKLCRIPSGLLVASVLLTVLGGCASDGQDESERLVLYCAHDAQFAEPIIAEFERQTGIRVDVRFDEEANKSLGLTTLLMSEGQDGQQARCDVFWNNQTLGTIRLQKAGILQPWHSSSADRFPERFRDPDFHWTGFAGRLRVYLVNTDQMPATQEAVDQLLDGESLLRFAVARPMFGTTLSHYSVLQAEYGEDWLKAWHTDVRRRGVREVRGNSMCRDLVAEGICDACWTDTDDAFVALDAGRPVGMLPVRLDDGRTICLPNSVAMIRGCPHPEAAKRLIDFLLSEDVERRLAASSARQIPLGTLDDRPLPDDVRQLQEWASESVSLQPAAEVNQAVLDWLTAESTGQ
ncbi:MAG: substrate-binding domain-containing protein [Planctomycetaceae bacterium]